MKRHRRWYRHDNGSVATEVALVTPFLILLLVLVAVVVHRGVDARLRINDATHQAARAASLARTPQAAVVDARATAIAALSHADVACRTPSIDTDTSQFEPGGMVVVTVTCTVDLRQASIPGMPGSTDIAATFTSPVDAWRAGGQP